LKAVKNIITVFEHQAVHLNERIGDVVFDGILLQAMQSFYGEKGVPYYSLIHSGVRFCAYVGVIEIGGCIIEVLPKADKNGSKSYWRDTLIGMLHKVGSFHIHAPTSSALKVKPNTILDLYFELLIDEAERILRQGLIKRYRKVDLQSGALNGSILFAQHIQRNLIHKEKFFVRSTVYDTDHLIHQLIYKALLLVQRINSNPGLSSRIGALLLNFPEQKFVAVSEAIFDRLILTRKTEHYRDALAISRLLLLNYHPNISKGRNSVLALMFDMNLLWERFVYVSLYGYFKKQRAHLVVKAYSSRYFWKPEYGRRAFLEPDIVINEGKPDCVILDTKWKSLKGYNPSPDDLRQLYAYHRIYGAMKVALVYPGDFGTKRGVYYGDDCVLSEMECTVIGIKVETNIGLWCKKIGAGVGAWWDGGIPVE
jgi:5-methylcytosine-specific restriction enzyme subunit McrC